MFGQRRGLATVIMVCTESELQRSEKCGNYLPSTVRCDYRIALMDLFECMRLNDIVNKQARKTD